MIHVLDRHGDQLLELGTDSVAYLAGGMLGGMARLVSPTAEVVVDDVRADLVSPSGVRQQIPLAATPDGGYRV